MLRDAGILSAEKRGKEVYYSVCYGEVVTKLRAIADAIESCCGGALVTGGESDKSVPDASPAGPESDRTPGTA